MRMGVVGERRVRAVTHLDVDAERGTTCGAGRPASALRGRDDMKLEGIHHITAITGDAPRNVDFYARVLGLRMVKKTVNQDDPTVYHLFYADELGSAGADLTFFEYPNARRGRAGAGMVHRIAHRVASADALDFWADRLGDEGVATARDGRRRAALRRSRGPLARARRRRRPRHAADRALDRGAGRARAPGLPRRRTPAVADPRKSEALLTDVLGFDGDRRARVRGARRGARRLDLARGRRGPRLRRRRHGPPHRVRGDARRARAPGASTSPPPACRSRR